MWSSLQITHEKIYKESSNSIEQFFDDNVCPGRRRPSLLIPIHQFQHQVHHNSYVIGLPKIIPSFWGQHDSPHVTFVLIQLFMGFLWARKGKGAKDELMHDYTQRVNVLLTGESIQTKWGFRRRIRKSPSRRVYKLPMLASSLGYWKIRTSVLMIRLPKINQLDQEILNNNDIARRDIKMRNLITLQEPNSIG